MLKIIKIAAFCLIMSFFIMKVDESNELRGKRKDKRLTAVLVIVLSFYCGLRTWYNDTVTYQQLYSMTPPLSGFLSNPLLSFSRGYGFEFLNSVMKTIGFQTQDFFLFYSFLTYILYFVFIRKYSSNLVLSVFLFFTNSWFIFSVASIKQCVATGFCLLALDYALNRKWVKFLIIIFVATMFHPYSFIYLLVPFMLFKPWTWKTYFYIVFFVAVGFALSFLLGGISFLTDLMGADYAEDEFSGEGVNIFRVAVCLAPTAVGFVFRNNLFHKSQKSEDLFFNLCMLNGLIMFVGIFGTANYFARLANYFLPMQVIVLPWFIKKLKDNNGFIISVGTLIGFSGFCYYENSILKEFDGSFAQMNFFDYLKLHF